MYKRLFTSCATLTMLFAGVCAGASTVEVCQGVGESSQPLDSIVVPKYYNINRSAVNHDQSLERLRQVTDSLMASTELTSVTIEGYSSPDGPQDLNRRLALKRAKGIRSYLVDHSGVPATLITVSSHPEDWDGFRAAVEAADDMADRDKVLALIDDVADRDACEKALRRLSGGRAWRQMARDIFPSLRRTVVTFRFPGRAVEVVIPDEQSTEVNDYVVPEERYVSVVDVVEEEQPVAEPVVVPVAEPGLNWYIKTNVPAWAMLWMNVAVEFDLAHHWSAQLPVYYSGFNYFKGDRKFRTFTIMPEVRWWPRADNQGFFAGAHFGMAYYNVAFGGDKRYQDHNQNTPALGGGIDLGYRLPISRNGRWHLEFSVGAGIYHLDYDVYNNWHNGLLIDRRKRTFYGIDNAAISVAYRFDLKKGGER